MSRPQIAIGARLGHFRLRAQLGEGGFAPVYLAAEEYGGIEVRIVALKVFLAARLGPAGFEQVVAEARALSRVDHPNVVKYLQIFEDKDAGVVGLAMEHVKGESLGARVARGAMPVADVLAVGAAIAGALAAVHAAGLVHRDIKPDNVIDAGGVYKLIDFGIATRRQRPPGAGPPSQASLAPPAQVSFGPGPPSGGSIPASAARETVTEVGLVAGRTVMLGPPRDTSPLSSAPKWQGEADYLADTETHEDAAGRRIAGTMGYIDPEVLKGAPPDPASDLFALGATLYECLTGTIPAIPPGSTTLQQAIAFGVESPRPARELAPELPDEVARLVDALVDPDRARRPRHAEAVAATLDRLRRGVARPRMLPPEGPFRGLDAFDERHRDVFFGRSHDVALALEALRARGVVALIGPSGAGKSSLARAGLVPAVVDGELGGWPRRYEPVLMRPGQEPRVALDATFARLLGRGLTAGSPETFVAAVGAYVESHETGVILCVDALEEIVTISAPGDREWFAEVLALLARTPVPGVRAIVTARRDFLDQLLALPVLGPTLARSVQLVAPLGGRSFAEAAVERLAAYGFTLEDDAMLADLARELDGAPEAMPLFEFALARLWDARDEKARRLTRAGLASIGGVAGALEQHAEATRAALLREHGPAIDAVMRGVLLALTTAAGTRTRRAAADVMKEAKADPRLARKVLDAFEAARLVVGEDGKLTLSHETLLARWPRLSQWLAAVRRERELAEEIEQATARWNEKEQERGLLARGRALRDARDLVQNPSVDLSAEARAYVQASRRAEARGVTGVAVLVASVVLGLGVLYGLYRMLERDARQKERHAEELASTLKKSQETPESDRVRAIKKLLEEKQECERELARCAQDALDAGADGAP